MNFDGYCVRIDARDGYADKIKMIAQSPDYTAVIAVKHHGKSGENPHYHAVVKTQVKDDAFRKRMKKVFDSGKGNGHMSIKPWDGALEAISYLFHEDESAAIVVRNNVSEETILKAKERNRTIQEQVKTAKERASWKVEDELYESLKTLHINQIPEEPDLAFMLVMSCLRSGKYVPNEWHVKAMATKLRFRLLNGDVRAEEALCNQIVTRIYRMEQPFHFEVNRYGNANPLARWG